MPPEFTQLSGFSRVVAAHPDLFLGGAAAGAGALLAWWFRRKRRPSRRRFSPLARAFMGVVGLLIVAAVMLGLYSLSLRNTVENIEQVGRWRRGKEVPARTAAAGIESPAPAVLEAAPQAAPSPSAGEGARTTEPLPEAPPPSRTEAPAAAVSSPPGAD